jgi:uncharacterized protein
MKPNYRRCVSCRSVAPKELLWRVVKTFPDGEVKIDRGQGRSAYLCPQQECLQKARLKQRLGRSLKTKIPESIYQILEERLTEKC